MKVIFNKEKEFPIIHANEVHYVQTKTKCFFINVAYNEKIYNELVDYLFNTDITNIAIYDDNDMEIYDTTTFVVCNQINKNLFSENKYINLEFFEKNEK